jgi:HPt (histidine-containing phosphotransfer) domain-containing protein
MPITNPDYSNLDHEEMAKAIGLKVKHIPILIGSFLEESKSLLETMNVQIEESDFEALRASAHSIKGSAGNLRFNELAEMARDIEFAAKAKDNSFDYKGYIEAIKRAMETISL